MCPDVTLEVWVDKIASIVGPPESERSGVGAGNLVGDEELLARGGGGDAGGTGGAVGDDGGWVSLAADADLYVAAAIVEHYHVGTHFPPFFLGMLWLWV